MTPKLRAYTSRPWPALAPWLTYSDGEDINRSVVYRAMQTAGDVEEPPGSNRGPRIDDWLRRAGVPEATIQAGDGWWCGAWAGCVLIDAGSLVPEDFGSVDSWLPFLDQTPAIGAVAIYGVPHDGHHGNILVRLKPLVLTVGGNQSWPGQPAANANNGIGVVLGPQTRTDVLGYFHPRRRV